MATMGKPKLKSSGLPGKDALIGVRLPPQLIKAIDRWAARDGVTRSDAICRLLRSALAASRAAKKLNIMRR